MDSLSGPIISPEQLDQLVATIEKQQRQIKKLKAAIRWALGYTNFKPRQKGDPPYWWRPELARRAGIRS